MKKLLPVLLALTVFGQVPPPIPVEDPLPAQVYWTITLMWDPVDSAYLRYHRIYQGVMPMNYTQYVTVGLTNRTTLRVPVRGVTNYLAATSIDDINQESDYSEEISFHVLPPPPKTNQVVTVSLQYSTGPTLTGPWTPTNIVLSVKTNPAANLFYQGGRLVVTNAIY